MFSPRPARPRSLANSPMVCTSDRLSISMAMSKCSSTSITNSSTWIDSRPRSETKLVLLARSTELSTDPERISRRASSIFSSCVATTRSNQPIYPSRCAPNILRAPSPRSTAGVQPVARVKGLVVADPGFLGELPDLPGRQHRRVTEEPRQAPIHAPGQSQQHRGYAQLPDPARAYRPGHTRPVIATRMAVVQAVDLVPTGASRPVAMRRPRSSDPQHAAARSVVQADRAQTLSRAAARPGSDAFPCRPARKPQADAV